MFHHPQPTHQRLAERKTTRFGGKANWAATACLSLLIMAIASCAKKSETATTSSETPEPPQKPLVIAVSYPLEYLTARIVGDRLDVRCPVPAGVPASKWKPNRDEIRTIQKAEVVVANGVGARFAKWLEMASIPASKVINSASRGLSLKDFIEIEDVRFTHSHGNLGEHSHPTNCAYTWLSPEMALKQARFINEELGRRYPAHADEFSGRYAELAADLKGLQSLIGAIPQSAASEFSAVMTTSPDLKFFTRACNWDDIHLKWFEAPEPATAIEELEVKLDVVGNRPMIKRGEKRLILSTYPLPEPLVESLQPWGLNVVVIDKLDVRPSSGDYLSVMQASIERLTKELAE